jgi:hypothetical protein
MRTESNAKCISSREHRLAMALYPRFVQDNCGFGNIMDAFANVEFAQVGDWWGLPLGNSHSEGVRMAIVSVEVFFDATLVLVSLL